MEQTIVGGIFIKHCNKKHYNMDTFSINSKATHEPVIHYDEGGQTKTLLYGHLC